MNRWIPIAIVMSLLALAVSLWGGVAQEPLAQPAGAEVQARGPVHEAFAEPIDDAPKQGPLIAKQPPDPIEELPPDQKPAGDNVQWIGGYWAWDSEANDYLWVSGFWRELPPGRRWIPGHWQQVEGGWLWVSGFWAPMNLQQVQYLPPPPPTIETGPSTPAPDAVSTYVGGCWFYQGRYLWRPGHWIAYRPGWVWIPAHYVWTPVGCCFVDGYWDHPLVERGILFAPVRFNLAVWLGARRPFVPGFVISSDFLMGALFIGPHTRHYYFGDYFEDRYAKLGFVAWADYHPRKGMFDPNFAYYRHLNAGEPGWETSLHELYTARRAGTVPRPPRTLALQEQAVKTIIGRNTGNVVISNKVNLTHVQNVTVLAPLKEVHNLKVTGLGALTPGKETKVAPHVMKLEAVPKAEVIREQKAAAQVHALGIERREAEAKVLTSGRIPVMHTDPPHVVKVAPPAHVAPPVAPRRVPPPVPAAPAHVEHAIPKYVPHPPPAPPKKK
jgi:WXXGXW repeat (2 copies)